MSEHHKDASVGVAQALFDGMPPAEQAQVRAEAETKGVSALEIVRLSLDILIAESRPASGGGRSTAPSGARRP
jgi:hypothetical protein